MAFTGDMIFNGGCGLFMEGEPSEMAACMQYARNNWPDDMKIYGGHDYMMKNMQFAALVDPKNQAIKAETQRAQQLGAQSAWCVPTLMSAEKQYNVFMRVFDSDIQSKLSLNNPVDCMGYLRQWKNTGRKPRI